MPAFTAGSTGSGDWDDRPWAASFRDLGPDRTYRPHIATQPSLFGPDHERVRNEIPAVGIAPEVARVGSVQQQSHRALVRATRVHRTLFDFVSVDSPGDEPQAAETRLPSVVPIARE